MRKFIGSELVIATHNTGKAQEISDLLKPYIEHFQTAGELNLAEPDETADSFEGNARLKAKAAARASGIPALADDSGLCVVALNGEPGIYSARWGGPEKNFDLAMQKLNDALGDAPDRRAYFICMLALAWPDGHTEIFEGRIGGQIIWPPRGEKGFGYDPIFVPDGHDRTFAEMDAAEKHNMSHRARAFARLVDQCLAR